MPIACSSAATACASRRRRKPSLLDRGNRLWRDHIRPAGAPPPRPTSFGTAGRLRSEQVADINRNARPTSSESAVHRFLGVHNLTHKKDPARGRAEPAPAQAGDRPDVAEARRVFIRRQPALDPNRLVFIDETWAATNMTRRYGRCARGLRLRASVPHGHWKLTTLVAGLRTAGI